MCPCLIKHVILSHKILLGLSLGSLLGIHCLKQTEILPHLDPFLKPYNLSSLLQEVIIVAHKTFRISNVFTVFINANEQTMADSAQEATTGKYGQGVSLCYIVSSRLTWVK